MAEKCGTLFVGSLQQQTGKCLLFDFQVITSQWSRPMDRERPSCEGQKWPPKWSGNKLASSGQRESVVCALLLRTGHFCSIEALLARSCRKCGASGGPQSYKVEVFVGAKRRHSASGGDHLGALKWRTVSERVPSLPLATCSS